MSDYRGDEGESINWRSSPVEIETILKLRRDFNEADIPALPALTMLSVSFLVPDDDASRRQEIDRTLQRLAGTAGTTRTEYQSLSR